MIKKLPVVVVVLVGVLFAQLSLAAPIGYTRDGLPEICGYVQNGPLYSPETTAYYNSIYGRDVFTSLHHYCWALFSYYRALQNRDNPITRRGDLHAALKDFDYVLRYMEQYGSRGVVLRSEILVRKGAVLLLQGEDRAALASFEEALDFHPDFVPAYVAMSNFFVAAGESGEAERVLRAGLEVVPDSALLRDKLDRLTAIAERD